MMNGTQQPTPPKPSPEMQLKLQVIELAYNILGRAELPLAQMTDLDCERAVASAMKIAKAFDLETKEMLRPSAIQQPPTGLRLK